MGSVSKRIFNFFNSSKHVRIVHNIVISGRIYSSNATNNDSKEFYRNNDKLPVAFETALDLNGEFLSDLTNKPVNNSALQDCNEDISHIAPYQTPTFNFASFVNKSHTLQQLVLLGVDLSKIESKKDVSEAILKLDFDRDIKKFLLFFQDLNINPDLYGQLITKAPHLLLQDLDNLIIRVNYLESKNFTSENISKIITNNPSWLTFSTQDIDYRLGFIQSKFRLNGNEVRSVAVKMPKLITYKMGHIEKNIFSVHEQMGFSNEETKSLVLSAPKIYLLNQDGLVSRFDYLHNTMKIGHKRILLEPFSLYYRKKKIQERHEFLVMLKKDQFNPKLTGYVSLKALLFGTDAQFCTNVAHASVDTYNKFLKTR